MMIEPEQFAEEHDGHERIDEARACLMDQMAYFQYCQDCDLLGVASDNGTTYQEDLTIRAVAQVMIVAVKKLAAMPPKEGPTTQEIIERIWSKVRNKI